MVKNFTRVIEKSIILGVKVDIVKMTREKLKPVIVAKKDITKADAIKELKYIYGSNSDVVYTVDSISTMQERRTLSLGEFIQHSKVESTIIDGYAVEYDKWENALFATDEDEELPEDGYTDTDSVQDTSNDVK